jgi:dTDP-4-amino-4,6-dideoxygalactose transaminase
VRERIAFLSPEFPPAAEILEDYEAILRSGRFSNSGPMERAFAAAVAKSIGDVSASVVASGTSGIELALRATSLPGRSRVLVASFTFVAGPLCVLRLGLRAVFLDVETESWHPDLSAAQDYVARNVDDVAAILLTNTFGVANERIEEWEALAGSHGLPLIIDSAAGFGSTNTLGSPLGSHGQCEIFSLHATKTLGIGEGGLVTSRSEQLINEIDSLKNFGFDSSRVSQGLGTNAKLPELSCALAMRQLAHLDERIKGRRELSRRYEESLHPFGFTFQPTAEYSAVAFVSALASDAANRDLALRSLSHDNIEAKKYYNPPVHEHSIFAGCETVGPLPVTRALSSRVLSLPTRSNMPQSQFDRVIEAIAKGVTF